MQFISIIFNKCDRFYRENKFNGHACNCRLFFFAKWKFNDIRVAGYVMMLVNIRLEQKRRIALHADVYPVKPLLKHQVARHAFWLIRFMVECSNQ